MVSDTGGMLERATRLEGTVSSMSNTAFTAGSERVTALMELVWCHTHVHIHAPPKTLSIYHTNTHARLHSHPYLLPLALNSVTDYTDSCYSHPPQSLAIATALIKDQMATIGIT